MSQVLYTFEYLNYNQKNIWQLLTLHHDVFYDQWNPHALPVHCIGRQKYLNFLYSLSIIWAILQTPWTLRIAILLLNKKCSPLLTKMSKLMSRLFLIHTFYKRTTINMSTYSTVLNILSIFRIFKAFLFSIFLIFYQNTLSTLIISYENYQ